MRLRPKQLSECIGQSNVKEKLSIAVQAARQRSEPLEHLLFYGPPGLGKTTLAHVIANEMGANIRVTSGTGPDQAGRCDGIACPTSVPVTCCLLMRFIGSVRPVEEFIYPAMEDFQSRFHRRQRHARQDD